MVNDNERLVVGAKVHAQASVVLTNKQENMRVHGSMAQTIMLLGIVQKVEVSVSAIGRKLIYIIARFHYGNCKKFKDQRLSLAQVKAG